MSSNNSNSSSTTTHISNNSGGGGGAGTSSIEAEYNEIELRNGWCGVFQVGGVGILNVACEVNRSKKICSWKDVKILRIE